MSDQRYTDEQMTLILRRAAELQARGEDAVHRLADIQRAAAEAGIEPALVARAASELGGAIQPMVAHGDADLFGAPRRIDIDRWVDAPQTGSMSPQVLAAIRRHSPELGEVRQIGEGMEWRYSTGYTESAVSIGPSGRGVRVHATGRFEGRHFMLNLIPVGAAMLSFFTAAAQGGGTTAFAAATAIAAGVLVGGFAGVRGLWNRVARRERLRLERLADATASALATPEETAGLEDGDPEPVGRIRR